MLDNTHVDEVDLNDNNLESEFFFYLHEPKQSAW